MTELALAHSLETMSGGLWTGGLSENVHRLPTPGANDLMKVKDAPAGGEVRDGYSCSHASMSLLKSNVLFSPLSPANCNVTCEAVQGEYPL